MRLDEIWTDTLLDFWASREAESEGDVFAYTRRQIATFGYVASRNQVRREILTRLRRYGFAPKQARMTAELWRIARDVYRGSKIRFRETKRGDVLVWRTDDYG